jgi:hypothetical protein
MAKSQNPKTTHLGPPNTTEHIDHRIQAVEVDNLHRWALRCQDCNKHIMWASERDYLWVKVIKQNKVSFRQLFWAPRYDQDWLALHTELSEEKELGKQQYEQLYKKKKLLTADDLGI